MKLPDHRLIEVKPGFKFALITLRQMLPDVETALFFAKIYGLDAQQLGNLLRQVFNTDLIVALTGESATHSSDLQDYILELGYEYLIEEGSIKMDDAVEPKGEILPELWKMAEVDVATSIKEVAEKLKDVVQSMPGKEGQMLFKSMMTLNARRPTIGDHKAYVHHAPKPDNLIVFDVSGSMSEETVRTLVDDVVALSYSADAYLAIVSTTTTWWEPGAFSTGEVLDAAEYAGTHYETLAPLFDRQWGVVVTIADYDSSWDAGKAIKDCRGGIELLLDISLVDRPTFLSEVLGQLAGETRPLLVAADSSCCMR